MQNPSAIPAFLALSPQKSPTRFHEDPYFLASAATASRSNAYKHVAGDCASETAFLEAYYAAVPTPKYFEFV